MRPVTLALIQLSSVLGDIQANLDKAEHFIRKAAAQGAQFVCLPETFLSGYDPDTIGKTINDYAVTPDSAPMKALCALASELSVYIIGGAAIWRKDKKKPDNAAFFIHDDGRSDEPYSKGHLFGPVENSRFSRSCAGQYPLYHTKYGCAGIIVCYDTNFPEPARILALKGAEIIFVPSSWSVTDADVWHLLIPARACENTVFVAACNARGLTGTHYAFGHSKIVNPRGTVIAEAGNSADEILMCTIDLDDIPKWRKQMRYLEDRDPGQYGFLADDEELDRRT